jgi:hypothetical protein
VKTAYADPIAQAAIDRLEAENAELVLSVLEQHKRAERLSSLVATYELDQQEDERIIAELRAKVAAVGALCAPVPMAACETECGWCGSVETCDRTAELAEYVSVEKVRAALAAKP